MWIISLQSMTKKGLLLDVKSLQASITATIG